MCVGRMLLCATAFVVQEQRQSNSHILGVMNGFDIGRLVQGKVLCVVELAIRAVRGRLSHHSAASSVFHASSFLLVYGLLFSGARWVIE